MNHVFTEDYSYARTRYAILPAADENTHRTGLTNSDIANASGASVPTVIDVLKKYYGQGIRAAIAPVRNPNSDTVRRREKNFTQKMLAEKLFVSDKAVSKWKRV